MTPSRPTVAGVVACLVMIAAACGFPVSDQVEYLAQDDYRELLDGTTSTIAPVAEPGESGSTPVSLYFVGPNNKLESVIRDFPVESTRNDVLSALEGGPLPSEIEQFEGPGILQTFVPGGLSAQFGALDDEFGAQRIIVDPAGELRQRVEEQVGDGRLIVSQIVCTVLRLNLAGVTGVEIYDGEEAIPLSDNAAQPIIGPAQLEDFDDCVTGTQELQNQLETEGEGGSSTTTTSG